MQPHKPVVPYFPFFDLCTDFFAADGSYLALCNKNSGWLLIYKFNKEDSQSIINALRKHFTRYGITKELATDGQRLLWSMEMAHEVSWTHIKGPGQC